MNVSRNDKVFVILYENYKNTVMMHDFDTDISTMQTFDSHMI